MDIVVENFTKRYGQQKAVDNISFRVNTGEVLGFLGPNGAGKTTTMKAITCFLAPSEGDIKVGGYSIKNESEKVKPLIGYLPENNPLYLDMAVIDYLMYVGRLQGVSEDKLLERVGEMIAMTGLEDEKHKNIGELSKGYRQRVGLAQAMIHNPEVLILDEPTTGLDPNQIIEIRELIKNIGKEKTVILSSHILAEVEATCDRIMIIKKGAIVADGTSADLRKKSQGKEILKITIEDANFEQALQKLNELPTVEHVEVKDQFKNTFEVQSKENISSKREVFNLCKNNNWFLTEMTPIETKLEDVFRELTLN